MNSNFLNRCLIVSPMRFYTTRWRYWYGYIAVFVLAALASFWHDRALDGLSWIAFTSALALFAVLEVFIRADRITVGKKSIIYSSGFFDKQAYLVKSKVKVKQNGLQKWLRIGTVSFEADGRDVTLPAIAEASKLRRRLHGK